MTNEQLQWLTEFLLANNLTIDNLPMLSQLVLYSYNQGWNSAIKEASNELANIGCDYGCRFVVDHLVK
jgi:hypothetical protein